MVSDGATTTRLRILIANEREQRLAAVAAIVERAGHGVVALLIGPSRVAAAVAEEDPDLAIVALGEDDEHALELVAQIVEEAACPVIVLLEHSNPSFVAEAARLGVFAHLTDADPAELQSAIEVALRRFDDMENLRHAFGRRMLVERAKGVLMERHAVGEREAFELLRSAARRRRERIVAVAEMVLSGARVADPADVADA